MLVENFLKFTKNYPNYLILSDSGWECSATDINSAYISHDKKIIILKQYFPYDKQYQIERYNELYGGSFEILYGEE